MPWSGEFGVIVGEPDHGLPAVYGRLGSTSATIAGSSPEVVIRPPRPPVELGVPTVVLVQPQVLVVAAPQREARMTAESQHVLAGLCFDLLPERLAFGVARAGEEEVLPHQHPGGIAGCVERVGLVDPAAPHPEQVRARADGVVHSLPTSVGRRPRGEDVDGDPIESADRDRRSVGGDREPGTDLVGARVDADRAESDAPRVRIECGCACDLDEVQADGIGRLRAVSAGPPRLGIRHGNGHLHVGPPVWRIRDGDRDTRVDSWPGDVDAQRELDSCGPFDTGSDLEGRRAVLPRCERPELPQPRRAPGLAGGPTARCRWRGPRAPSPIRTSRPSCGSARTARCTGRAGVRQRPRIASV